MPNGEIFKGLSQSIMRAAFKALIPSYVRLGLSMNAMILNARSLGLGYRRTIMLRDIRNVMGLVVGEARQRLLRPETLISRDLMPKVSYEDRDRFYVRFNVKLQSQIDGHIEERTFSYWTNEQLSKSQYEAIAWDRFEAPYQQLMYNVLDITHASTVENDLWRG